MIRSKTKYILVALMASISATAQVNEEQSSKWTLTPQVGYTMGGMTPIPMVPEIRKINEFKPLQGLSLGLDLSYQVDKDWQLKGGLQYFNRGMKTEAQVKGYHMTVKQGDNSLRGYFTGHNHSEAEQSGFALPLQAEWQATKRFSIMTGPVFEYYIQRQFSGSVTDGYLRVDVPTGNKVLFGAMGENSPTYDFSNDMSRFGLGWQLGLAYRFASKWQAYALGRYIFTNTFEPKFETINMRLHPVYLTLGLAYQIKL